MKRTKLPSSEAGFFYSEFVSSFGHAAVVWSQEGLRALLFPRESRASLKVELSKKYPFALSKEVVPRWVLSVIKELKKLLEGHEHFDLEAQNILLDLRTTPEFHQKVYREALKIKRGQTISYGELAQRAGSPRAARAVGQAMARNPLPLIIPCHRVLASNGKLTGFTAPGGLSAKKRLLAMERGES